MGGWEPSPVGYYGLKSAEIFHPKTSRSCSVGNLNIARSGPSICHNIVCGGWVKEAERSCEKFDGISTFTSLPVRLVGVRWSHSCWGLKSGDVLLFGGYTDEDWKYDKDSTSAEKVSADGSSSKIAFTFDYHIA